MGVSYSFGGSSLAKNRSIVGIYLATSVVTELLLAVVTLVYLRFR